MRELLADIFKGFGSFSEAIRFIHRHGLSYYYLFPVVITLVLWLAGFNFVSDLVAWLQGHTESYLKLEPSTVEEGTWSWFWSFWETLKAWYSSGSAIVLALIVKLIFFIVLLITGKYVMLALLSPALALISERTEEILIGKSYPFKLGRFLRDVLRGVLVASRNFLMEMSLVALIWVLTSFLWFLAPFSAALSLLISSYYYGFSVIDYWSERQEMSLRESFKFVRQHKGLAIALGVLIALAVKVPLIGFALAGSASIIGAVAAVIAVDKLNLHPDDPVSSKYHLDT